MKLDAGELRWVDGVRWLAPDPERVYVGEDVALPTAYTPHALNALATGPYLGGAADSRPYTGLNLQP